MIISDKIKEILSDSAKDIGIFEWFYKLGDLLDKKTTFQEYELFYLHKKSGGKRQIAAPNFSLYKFQECLKYYFIKNYIPHEAVNGFVNGKSILSNAQKHTNKNYVFCLDIKNFFGTIEKEDIIECLVKEPLGLSEEDAETISFICTFSYLAKDDDGDFVIKNELPQGAPTSPVLSNMVFDELDRKISFLAKQCKVSYSRYADDMTFSSNINKFEDGSNFITKLCEIIEDSKFTINKRKTRLQPYWKKQVVTGLIVNDGVNVPRKYIKDIRTMLYIWDKYGVEEACSSYCKHHRSKGRDFYPEYFVRILFGKIMFVRMVRGGDDPLVGKFLDEFNRLTIKTFGSKYNLHNKKYEYKNKLELANGEYYYIPNYSVVEKKDIKKSWWLSLLQNSGEPDDPLVS